jgi:hypothetical protein
MFTRLPDLFGFLPNWLRLLVNTIYPVDARHRFTSVDIHQLRRMEEHMAKGALIAAMDYSTVDAGEFNDWYDTEHIPERQRARLSDPLAVDWRGEPATVGCDL